MRSTSTRVAALAIAGAFLFGACSDDDDGGTETDTGSDSGTSSN